MPRIAVRVPEEFRVVCEKRRRSMSSLLSVIVDAYVAKEDIVRLVSAWEDGMAKKVPVGPAVPSGVR